jgi:hypothetical protein
MQTMALICLRRGTFGSSQGDWPGLIYLDLNETVCHTYNRSFRIVVTFS